MAGLANVDLIHPRFNHGLTLCLGETFTILGYLGTLARFPEGTRPDWDGLNQFRTGGNQAEIFAQIEIPLALLVSKDPYAINGIQPETCISWIA